MITGTAVCLTNTATQENPVLQYINLGITIAVGLVTLAYTLYKWYKKASEDGKITHEEVNDLFEEVGEAVEDLTNKKGEEE